MVQTWQILVVCKRRYADAARTHVKMGNVAAKRRTSSRAPCRCIESDIDILVAILAATPLLCDIDINKP